MKILITCSELDKTIRAFNRYITKANNSSNTIMRVNAMALSGRLDKLKYTKSTGALCATIEFHTPRMKELINSLINPASSKIEENKAA